MDRTNEQKGSQVGERVARFRGRSPDGTADRPIFKFARYPFESGMQPTLSPRRMQPVQPYPSPSTDRSTIIRNWAKSDLRSRCTDDSLTKGRHSRDRPDRKDGLSHFSTVNFRNDRLHCEKARLKFFQFARPTIFRHSMVIKGSASIASKRRFGRAPYRDAGCPSFFRAVRKRSNESGLALRAYCRPRKRTIVSWHFRRARDLGRFNGSLIPS